MAEKHDETKLKMRTVYDATGKAYVVDPVDAREYLDTGRYTAQPPVAEVKHEVKEPAPQKPEETKKT